MASIPGTMYGKYRELNAPSAPWQLRPAEATTANARVDAASIQVPSASGPLDAWDVRNCTDRARNSQHTAAPTTTPKRVHKLTVSVVPKARAGRKGESVLQQVFRGGLYTASGELPRGPVVGEEARENRECRRSRPRLGVPSIQFATTEGG